MPNDPFEAARVDELMSYLASTVHVSHAHIKRGARWSDDPDVIEKLKLKVPQNMAEHAAYLESRFGDGKWAMGDAFTVADAHLFVLTSWLGKDGVDINKFPKLAAHAGRSIGRSVDPTHRPGVSLHGVFMPRETASFVGCRNAASFADNGCCVARQASRRGRWSIGR